MSRVLRRVSPLVVFLLLATAGCSEKAAPKPTGETSVPVVVTKATRTSIPVELRAIGTGQASKTVSVESQVAGIVKDVHYRQGQFVKKGDLLITLDDRPFVAAVNQAEAALARDKAQAQLDEVELGRYRELFEQGIVAREQYDQYLATASSAKATVAADEAAVQSAKVQFSYCSIHAPISGVTGAQLAFPGAAVKAADAPVLVVINQVSPLFVSFSVPQQYLNDVKTFMARGRLPVEATPPDATVAERGLLSFVNNTVDPSTGTIQLMATFANPARQLWPGQFSKVVLRLAERENVLVVPSAAVETGQHGTYVFAIKPDMTAEVRTVKTGRTVGGVTEITQGLAAGETVVTDGQIRLVSGTKVYFTKGL
jgi:membrane fusion protein, multidrug efflux system